MEQGYLSDNPLPDSITKDHIQYTFSMKRYSIIASGRVQGVGFRFYVQNIAENYRLHGWTKNLPNGTVHIEIEGDEDDLDLFIKTVKNTREGYIQVDTMEIQEIAIEGTPGFFIKRY